MKGMAEDELLNFLADQGVAAADQLRKEQAEARDTREMVAGTKRALAAALRQHRHRGEPTKGGERFRRSSRLLGSTGMGLQG